jgi:hypothetical protein
MSYKRNTIIELEQEIREELLAHPNNSVDTIDIPPDSFVGQCVSLVARMRYDNQKYLNDEYDKIVNH